MIKMRMTDLTEDVLISLRQITRATSLHSRRLAKDTGLTTPQLLVLKDIQKHDGTGVSDIARRISLSQATVTSLVNKLEGKDLILRIKSTADKRRTDITLSAKGEELVKAAPPPLQENFVERFVKLQKWEQLLIVASLERLATMMDAEKLDAAPLLASGEDVR
ncbi:MAG: DNA-binding MarR family transcriptional regulator [Pseudohongiellaceae bacterium]|jgi:DNA-binding MarR family transcriptional regulator